MKFRIFASFSNIQCDSFPTYRWAPLSSGVHQKQEQPDRQNRWTSWCSLTAHQRYPRKKAEIDNVAPHHHLPLEIWLLWYIHLSPNQPSGCKYTKCHTWLLWSPIWTYTSSSPCYLNDYSLISKSLYCSLYCRHPHIHSARSFQMTCNDFDRDDDLTMIQPDTSHPHP